MPRSKVTPRRILGLIASYFWAIPLIILGSIVGALIVSGVTIAVLPLIGMNSNLAQLSDALSLGMSLQAALASMQPSVTYSNSALSILITATTYLAPLGVWIVVLIFLRISKASRPILLTVTSKFPGNTLRRLVFGLGLGFALNAACVLVALLSGSIELSYIGFNPLGLIIVALCVFIQSSAEELVVRCYLFQRSYKVSGSPIVALVLSAAFFVLLHLFNPGVTALSLINLFLVGILFGLLVWKLNSPWAAFGCHAAWNFTQSILFGLPNSGLTVPFAVFGISPYHVAQAGIAYDPTFGIEGSFVASVMIILGCALIWWTGTTHHIQLTDIWGKDSEQKAAAPLSPSN